MNTYTITCKKGDLIGRAQVEASNIHTAIKRALYRSEPGLPGKALSIEKGQKVTIEVERTK